MVWRWRMPQWLRQQLSHDSSLLPNNHKHKHFSWNNHYPKNWEPDILMGQKTANPGLTHHPKEDSTRGTHNVSLMVLPVLIRNHQEEFKFSMMFDPCLTSSYFSENAAEGLSCADSRKPSRLQLHEEHAEIKKRSRLVEFSVANLIGSFATPLLAHVLDYIASDTPAFQCVELNDKWPYSQEVSFENVFGWRFIDVIIGSDYQRFHLASTVSSSIGSNLCFVPH